MKIKLITGLLSGFVLYACTFEITGEHFTEVPEEATSTLVYDISDLEDSLLILEPMDFKFLFNVQGGRFYQVEAFINSIKIFSSYSGGGTITIDPFLDSYSSGYHNFKMNVYTSTGTGSIADQAGYEAVVYSLERVVEFDKFEAEDLPYTVIENEGRCEIIFEPYRRKNLAYVSVYTSETREGLFNSANRLDYVTDPSQPFEDLSYIGGKRYYGIEVFAHAFKYDPSKFTSEPKEFNLSPVPAVHTIEKKANNTATVRWNPTPFTENFDSYTLSYTTFLGGKEATLTQSLDNAATSELLLDMLPFGAPSNITLTTKTKKGNTISSDTTISLGEAFLPFETWVQDAHDTTLMALINENTVTVYKDGVAQPPLAGAPEKLNLFSRLQLAIGIRGTTLLYYRLSDLSLTKEVDLNNIDPLLARLGARSVYALTADHLIVFNRFPSLINTASMSIVQSVSDGTLVHVPETGKVIVLHSSAKYHDLYMYTFSNGRLGERELNTQVVGGALYNAGEYLIVASIEGEVEVRSKTTLELIHSYQIPGVKNIAHFDPFSHAVLAMADGLVVVDAVSGTERLRIPAAGGSYRLYNKVLYNGWNRTKLRLQY